jgi:hypothetical protein
MKNSAGQSVYSRTIQLAAEKESLSFVSVINPFGNELVFDIVADQNGKTDAELIDATGKIVRRVSFEIAEGVNRLRIDQTNLLGRGIYFLRVKLGSQVIQKRVMKQ